MADEEQVDDHTSVTEKTSEGSKKEDVGEAVGSAQQIPESDQTSKGSQKSQASMKVQQSAEKMPEGGEEAQGTPRGSVKTPPATETPPPEKLEEAQQQPQQQPQQEPQQQPQQPPQQPQQQPEPESPAPEPEKTVKIPDEAGDLQPMEHAPSQQRGLDKSKSLQSSMKKSKMSIKQNVSFINDRMKSGEMLQSEFSSELKKHSTMDSRLLRESSRKSHMRIRPRMESLLSIRRASFASLAAAQKIQKYANTYKLDSEKAFNVDRVRTILMEVLNEAIADDMVYDPRVCPSKASWACHTIRNRVKDQKFDRYKIVCIVTIGEKKSQDVFSAVRFLWDCERDRYASHVYENMYVFAVAVVFGLYYE